jgi:hypothetical protein
VAGGGSSVVGGVGSSATGGSSVAGGVAGSSATGGSSDAGGAGSLIVGEEGTSVLADASPRPDGDGVDDAACCHVGGLSEAEGDSPPRVSASELLLPPGGTVDGPAAPSLVLPNNSPA